MKYLLETIAIIILTIFMVAILDPKLMGEHVAKIRNSYIEHIELQKP